MLLPSPLAGAVWRGGKKRFLRPLGRGGAPIAEAGKRFPGRLSTTTFSTPWQQLLYRNLLAGEAVNRC